MRPTRLWRLLPGAALILLSAGSSLAMTLGRAQGLALLGRPLDLTVPVVLDAGADPTQQCPMAEVFYGEARVEGVTVALRPTGGDNAAVRVQVSRPVDEAFVSVQVRVGCTQMLSRKFVLLTEEPGEAALAAAQPTPVAPAVIAAPTALPVRPLEAAPAWPAPAVSGSALPAAAASQAPAPVRRVRPARVAAERPATPAARPTPVTPKLAPPPAAPVVERPRLKLDAADLAAPAAGLKPGGAGLEPKPAAAPERAEAPAQGLPAAQAAAPAAPPDESARNAERMMALEADIRAMREGMLQNQAMLAQMRGRLEQAESERYANGLVYALAALLAAASGLAGLFWYRGRRAAAISNGNWWADRPSPELAPVAQGAAPTDAAVAVAVSAAAASQPGVRTAIAGVSTGERAQASATTMAGALAGLARASDSDSGSAPPAVKLALPEHARDAGIASGEVPGADVGALDSGVDAQGAGGLREGAGPVSLDELNDLQQQAEFFVSLGEYERAVAVLREHINAHPQASAVAWLELLDLYHRQGRESDYEQLRRDYEWVFSHQLPAFGEYGSDGRGIEQHAEVMARIEGLWNQPAVVPVIEQAVLGTPREQAGRVLGLQALRDLLMLHGVATDRAETDVPAMPAPTALPAAVAVAAAMPVASDGELSASGALGTLDALDLGALSLDPHPGDEWKKLGGVNARPAGLDLNLDDLDLPPTTDASVKVGRSFGGTPSHLLDFDLDLSEDFKLPKR